MMEQKLGEWRWYLGSDTDDDEMCECVDREAAIRLGLKEFARGDSFYVVEARMLIEDEDAMARGDADSARFAESRNGEWIDNGLNAVTH